MSAVTAKYGAVSAPVVAAALAAHSDTLFKVAAVVGGILLGMLWRAGSLRGEGRSWETVRSDLAVSSLIGGANAVLALALVEAFDASVMFAMATGVLVGATGLRALPEIRAAVAGYLRRRLLGDDIALIQPKNRELTETVKRLRETEE